MTGEISVRDQKNKPLEVNSGSFVVYTRRLARDIFDAEQVVKIPALLLLAVMALVDCKLNELIRIDNQISFTLWSYLRTRQHHGPQEQVRSGLDIRLSSSPHVLTVVFR